MIVVMLLFTRVYGGAVESEISNVVTQRRHAAAAARDERFSFPSSRRAPTYGPSDSQSLLPAARYANNVRS